MYKKTFSNIIRIVSVSIFLSLNFAQTSFKDSSKFKSNRLLNHAGENWKTLSIFNNYSFDTNFFFLKDSLINQYFSLNFIKNKLSLLYFNNLSHKNFFGY